MQFIYLFISLYYGRKNPLFFLLFPIALLQGYGALIDPRTVLVAPEYFLLGKNIFKDLVIIYLIFIVFVIRKKIDFKIIKNIPMKANLIYIIVLAFVTLFQYGTEYEAIAIIRLFLYMYIGFILIVLIMSTITKEQFLKFIQVLFWINAIQCLLYIINSSQIYPIFYKEKLYQEIIFGNKSFYRDFYTIPIFSNFLFVLSFSLILLKNRIFNKSLVYINLIVYPFVLLYTFTRSMLIASCLELIIILVILLKYRTARILKVFPFILALLFLGIIPYANSIFPNELSYFNNRIANAIVQGKSESNIDIRIHYHEAAFNIVNRNQSLLFGCLLNKRFEREMDSIGAWTADSTIPFWLLYTGAIGVLFYFFYGLYFANLIRKNHYLNLNPMAITLFALIVTSIISALFMGGQLWGSPIIFMNYAFAYYIRNNSTKSKKNITESKLTKQTVEI